LCTPPTDHCTPTTLAGLLPSSEKWSFRYRPVSSASCGDADYSKIGSTYANGSKGLDEDQMARGLATAEAVGASFDAAEQLYQQGRLEESAALWPEVIASYEALEGGSTGMGSLPAKGNYALVLSDQGKLEEAAKLYREMDDVLTASLGAGHWQTLMAKSGYAIVLQNQA